MNKRPQMKAMWIEHNKKEFGSRIVALENIIRSQVKATGKSDQFTSDMLVAIKSGRKITPKMEKAINNIIHRNKPEEMAKRVDWGQSVVPKIVMVTNLINETDWSDLYKSSKVYFLESEEWFKPLNNLLYKSKNGRVLMDNAMRYAYY